MGVPRHVTALTLLEAAAIAMMPSLVRGWFFVSRNPESRQLVVVTFLLGTLAVVLLIASFLANGSIGVAAALARGEAVGCFGLTEPDHGSDPGAMKTRASRRGDAYVLNGTKLWITNGSIADVAVVWANAGEEHGGIRGFVVPTDTPGFSAPEIKHKMSLRASVTSELVLDDVRLPQESRFPEVSSLPGPPSCLNEARYGIVWGSMGAARACFEAALEYAKERIVFEKPISAYQLTQQKLAEMALEVNRGSLVALHLGRMKDAGKLRPEQVSLGKMGNVRGALEVCRSARSVLGGNGITLEYPVIRHMNNLESVLTYEGTHEVHTLVVGEALTGRNAFR